ncbi:hypothetical protein BDN72DRAFT_955061 [Pluteus cervinus]|uniref:Uncharacterized protein n=1 Tax=Pluteus cervinus TaxID=181527 RepID=A0ACD3BEL3_9AGAR|nr:hypothetical protein BDN72DRAFT_955061 [Pluteus cervinus]
MGLKLRELPRKTLLSGRPMSMSMNYLVRTFTPVWFAATMGTGAVSGLFNAFPYQARAMTIFCLIFWFLNLFIFVLFTGLTIARYALFPKTWSPMIEHPVLGLYYSCMPMGGTTLINVAVQVVHGHYHLGGKSFMYTLWAFWWLDVAVSALCCWGGVHVMFTKQTHLLSSMTTVWLLPVVTLIVAASSGGVVSLALEPYSPFLALITTTVSAFIVCIGFSLAFMILTLYLLRLIIHGLPPGASVLSVFLPLGPTGQAGYAFLLIGTSYKSLLPVQEGNGSSTFLTSQTTGDFLHMLGISIAFFLWSLASMWLLFALLAVAHAVQGTRLHFKLTFWGLVFPNGVYANLTINLAQTFDSSFFRVWGAIYAVGTLLLWIYVTVNTTIKLYNRLIAGPPPPGEIQPPVTQRTLPS